MTAEFVIGAYHQLFQIEKTFRMAKSDLQARPVSHRLRDSIEAHLTVVFAALAVSRQIEGPHVVTATDPIPDDLSQAIDAINSTR